MKKLLLFMSIAAIAGLLFYFFYWSPVYRIKPLNLIPSNTTQKETLYISFIENLVVISLTPTLTESAILQYIQPPEKDIYFLEITDELGFGGLVRAYVTRSKSKAGVEEYAMLLKSTIHCLHKTKASAASAKSVAAVA